MQELSRQVSKILVQRLCERASKEPVVSPELLPHSGNLRCVASLRPWHCLERFVVKESQPRAHISCPQALLQTHEWIRQQDPQLAQSLPVMRDYYADRRWIVMDYVPGQTLLRELRSSLHWLRNSSACR